MLRRILAILACLLMVCPAEGFDPWSPFVDRDSPFPFYYDGRWGFIDRQGVVVVEPTLKSADYFSEGLAAVCSEPSRCGYIDARGRTVIEFNYWWVNPFSEGVAAVGLEDGTVILLNSTGAPAEIQPPKGTISAEAMIFGDGLAPFQAYHKAGFFARNGSVLVDRGFFHCGAFQNGLAVVVGENSAKPSTGAINTKGKIVIPLTYKHVRTASEGLVAAMFPEGQWGYLDYQGNVVIKPKFYSALEFKEGLAPAAAAHEQWGYIDRRGEWLVKPKYIWATPFSEGLAAVSPREGILTIIDRKRDEIFTVEGMMDAGPWRNGIALFMSKDGTCYIDRAGQVVWPKEPADQRCKVRFLEDEGQSTDKSKEP